MISQRVITQSTVKRFFPFNKLILIWLGLCGGICYQCSKEDFRWNLIKAPELGELVLISNTVTGATVNCTWKTTGHDENMTIGFCWSEAENPTLSDNVLYETKKSSKQFSTTFSWYLNSSFHVRAFAANSIDTVYSNELLVNFPGNLVLPTIQTTDVSSIYYYGFTANADIINTHGLPILSKGFYVSTSSNPTSQNSIHQIVSGNEMSFHSDFSSMNDGSTYYLRAFVSTLAGTGLGNIIQLNLPKKYFLGETGPGSGIIFYENPDPYDTWHYLEAAPFDFNGFYVWSNNVTQTSVTATEIGEGLNNTIDILNLLGGTQNYAAKITYDWVFGGKTDWALPSFEELKLMKEYFFEQGTGGFSSDESYWSSSEDANYFQNAWTVKMTNTGNNLYTTQSKTLLLKVRALRRF